MDSFHEYLVKKQNTRKDNVLLGACIAGAVCVVAGLFLLLLPHMGGFVLLLVCGVAYGAYRLLQRFFVEFEYSVTNGELDVDCIVARRKRKRLLTVHARNFEYFAPLNEAHREAFESSSIGQRIVACSRLDAPDVWFACYYQNNIKKCVAFQPTEGMRQDFARYVPRTRFFAQ